MCRKAYHQKKKNIVWSKYYEKLFEDSLKKRYKSIPVEDRLPIGIMESYHDELDKILSPECATESVDQQFEKLKELVNMEGNLPPIFDLVLMPVKESLPSSASGPSEQCDILHIIFTVQRRSSESKNRM